jgi:hypothetical protein
MHLRGKCLKNAVLYMLSCCIATQVYAGSAHLLMPPEKTVEACQMRLSVDGRVVAQMRWILEFDREKAHCQFTPNGTPLWYEETVRGWIDSAYEAEDPKVWFESEWLRCEEPI